MTQKDLSFSKLVKDINKKWGHTYLDPVVSEEELDEQEVTIEEWEDFHEE
jgi:hypothetical protein